MFNATGNEMTTTSKPLDLSKFEGHTPPEKADGETQRDYLSRLKRVKTYAEAAAFPALLSECRRQREELDRQLQEIAQQSEYAIKADLDRASQREQIKALREALENHLAVYRAPHGRSVRIAADEQAAAALKASGEQF